MTKKHVPLNIYIIISISILIILGMSEIILNALQTIHNKPIEYNYQNFYQKNKNTKDGVIVFAYHRILSNTFVTELGENVSHNPQLQEYNVNKNTFYSQMKWLKKNKVSIWTMDEFIKHKTANNIKGKHVVITFDDVDTTLYHNGVPILNKYDFPYTVFIVTGETGTNLDGEQLSTWNEITKMNKQKNVNIGVHTHKLHYQINNKPAIQSGTISPINMNNDYEKSVRTLKNKIGESPQVFAYPYGGQNQQLSDYMINHGIKGIFLLTPGLVTNDPDQHLSQIPRIIITDNNFDQVKKWLH